MKRFEVIDHTADVGIAAYGADLKEAFANAAYGMFSLMVDLKDVTESLSREVEVTADDQHYLLVAWLNELIYLFDVENILFKRFKVAELGQTRLRASCFGEKVDPERHKITTAIKAVTYHMLKIDEGDGFRVQVLFDI